MGFHDFIRKPVAGNTFQNDDRTGGRACQPNFAPLGFPQQAEFFKSFREIGFNGRVHKVHLVFLADVYYSCIGGVRDGGKGYRTTGA